MVHLFDLKAAHFPTLLIERHIALATITAALALMAQMQTAGILCAPGADFCGNLITNAATKSRRGG